MVPSRVRGERNPHCKFATGTKPLRTHRLRPQPPALALGGAGEGWEGWEGGWEGMGGGACRPLHFPCPNLVRKLFGPTQGMQSNITHSFFFGPRAGHT